MTDEQRRKARERMVYLASQFEEEKARPHPDFELLDRLFEEHGSLYYFAVVDLDPELAEFGRSLSDQIRNFRKVTLSYLDPDTYFRFDPDKHGPGTTQ